MKQEVLDNIKNIFGWRSYRKVIVFSVDDYGNVRLASKQARIKLEKAGLRVYSRFDALDTLETRQDLEILYETLTSVKDKNGNPAIFTPYALPCNPDFETMATEEYRQYRYELLPDTYQKLSQLDPQSYQGAWNLWQEGINGGWMAPQFHGREHLNLKFLKEKLAKQDAEVLAAFKNRSCTSFRESDDPGISWTSSFSYSVREDTITFPEILQTGTDAFESVFGYRAECFTPPAMQFPKWLENSLSKYGIRHLDKSFHHLRHLGGGKYKREFNTMKRDKDLKLNILVRNVVFEPTDGTIDHVGKAMQQIEAAFRWRKPAIISSHRVNFCGHIDENNRKTGITALKSLLRKIVRRWPDVEFMACHEVGNLMKTGNND